MPTNKFLHLLELVKDQKWVTRGDCDFSLIRNEKDQSPICAIVDVLSNGTIVQTDTDYKAWCVLFGMEITVKDYPQLRDIVKSSAVSYGPLRKELETILNVAPILTQQHVTALTDLKKRLTEEFRLTGRWSYFIDGWAGQRLNELLAYVEKEIKE